MQSIGHDLRRGLNNFNPLGNNYKNINKWLAELKNLEASLKTLDKEISTEAKLVAAWGVNEGDDMTDICQRMTQLMEEVGLAHQAYSINHTDYRKRIKSLKTQEMGLDDNRKKKQDLTNQIAKLQKSSKDPIKLMDLHSALERVSAELVSQEMHLLQYKRVTIKDAFNSKFDAMIELSEKMALIAGYGRQITQVIDTEAQFPDRARLYSGAEFTAAAVSQVKMAVTSWKPSPANAPMRTHITPAQDELALSAAANSYNRTPPISQSFIRTHSPTEGPTAGYGSNGSNGNGNGKNTDSWDGVQMLKLDASRTSLHEAAEYENWKQEAPDEDDRRSEDSYRSSPGINVQASPYVHSQQISQLQEQQRQLSLEQQRMYQQNLSSFSPAASPAQQHYQIASTGSGSGRFTPTTLRRSDTQDLSPSVRSHSPSYGGYQQQQAASYDTSSPTRSYRLGFNDPRDRNKLDNSDVYKSDASPSGTIASRFARSPLTVDGK